FQRDKTVLNRSACRVSSEKPERLAVFAYNFGTKPVRGPLKLTMPDGWRGRVSSEIVLAPMERKDIGFVVEATKASGNLVGTVCITGQFGPAGRSVLSFRLMPDPIRLDSRQATPIAGAGNPARWERMISGKGLMRLAARNDGVLVEAEPAGSDRWVYPRYLLAEGERAPAGCAGIVCALTLLEGDGDFRVIFDEGNGAAYVADFLAKPRRGESVEALALFEAARAGHGWSKPDPNNRLDPDQIGSFKIGCNTQGGRVSFVVSNVRWVRF
ncbi:MAG: hypothetical protein N2689_14865, partial [Verrucomicrobiae bacterium]|nr:hypothetical protein [Verrucomicrobiae bacterium]